MKLTNLFKKLLTAAMAVALLGMLAGCANGGDSSDSGSGGSKFDASVMYSVEYNGNELYSVDGSDVPMMLRTYGLVEGTDYTVDNSAKKIILTDSGKAKTENGYTLLIDSIKITDMLPEATFNTLGLIENTDYTKSGRNITLTDSGLLTYLNAGHFYAVVVYSGHLINMLTQSEYNSYSTQLTLNTDYTLSHNNRVVTLTASGYSKVSQK